MTNSSPLPPPARNENVSARTIIIFILMWTGVAFNIQLSIHMLPTTIRELTSDPRIIGLLLAMNPLFGFIAQPIVGILGDRIWTGIGRRAFFIIVSAPITAVCLWLIPEAAVLWQLFLIVVLYEFFTDIIIGSDHPLIADLVPPRQRLLVNAIIVTSLQLAAIIILKWGFGVLIKEKGDAIIYQIGAAAQIFLIMIPAFFLKESPPEPEAIKRRITPKRYVLDIWENVNLRRLAGFSFLSSVFDNLILTFLVLFATETLSIDKSDYGSAMAMMPMIGLALALPSGWVIEKFIPKQRALMFSILCELAACVVAITADGVSDITLIAVLFGIGMIIKNVTMKPFFTEFIPKDRIGQVLGGMNIMYAVGRTCAAAAGGFLAYWLVDGYRGIFYIAILIGVAAVIQAWRITDQRFLQRIKNEN